VVRTPVQSHGVVRIQAAALGKPGPSRAYLTDRLVQDRLETCHPSVDEFICLSTKSDCLLISLSSHLSSNLLRHPDYLGVLREIGRMVPGLSEDPSRLRFAFSDFVRSHVDDVLCLRDLVRQIRNDIVDRG
jgi:hypothetical protein